MGLTVHGADKLARDVGGMAARARDQRRVNERQVHRLEAHEAALFGSYGGKYVRTGALKASLTTRGGGAVREITGHGVRFGTDIPYARYQTEHVGPPTERGGMRRSGANMVLKLPPEERAVLVRDVGNFIMRGQA